MGCIGFSKTCGTGGSPAPDPHQFTVLWVEPCGNAGVLAKVRYPSTTNYEGEKLMVVLGITIPDFFRLEVLDPHFQEAPVKADLLGGSVVYRIIARYEPSLLGEVLAKELQKSLAAETAHLPCLECKGIAPYHRHGCAAGDFANRAKKGSHAN